MGSSTTTADGHVREQKARIVVLAGNGVGTPRLLLNSRSPSFPTASRTGRGWWAVTSCSIPTPACAASSTSRSDGLQGPIGCAIISQEFYETDVARGFVRGCSFQIARGLSPIANATGGLSAQRVPWGASHRAAYQARFDRTITVAVIGDDLPEEHNRVELDGQLVDGDGIPAPRIVYTLSQNSRRLLDHGIARAEEVLAAAGAHAIEATPLLRSAGWHLMGTARMGADPRRSVVDSYGRCHEVKNLYIIDGSVFVTGGAVNPTSTIQAVALRAAESREAERPQPVTPRVLHLLRARAAPPRAEPARARRGRLPGRRRPRARRVFRSGCRRHRPASAACFSKGCGRSRCSANAGPGGFAASRPAGRRAARPRATASRAVRGDPAACI